jgi:hypothetical protein
LLHQREASVRAGASFISRLRLQRPAGLPRRAASATGSQALVPDRRRNRMHPLRTTAHSARATCCKKTGPFRTRKHMASNIDGPGFSSGLFCLALIEPTSRRICNTHDAGSLTDYFATGRRGKFPLRLHLPRPHHRRGIRFLIFNQPREGPDRYGALSHFEFSAGSSGGGSCEDKFRIRR